MPRRCYTQTSNNHKLKTSNRYAKNSKKKNKKQNSKYNITESQLIMRREQKKKGTQKNYKTTIKEVTKWQKAHTYQQLL